MKDEFKILMEQGNDGLIDHLKGRKPARNFTRSIDVSHSNLLIEFLEENDVGEPISITDDKSKDLNVPLLVVDGLDGQLKLQTFLSVLSDNETAKSVVDRISYKYKGFSYIDESTQDVMVRKFLERYDKKMTKPASQRIASEHNIQVNRLLDEYLSMFIDKRTDEEITRKVLTTPLDSNRIILSRDITSHERIKQALAFFNEQPQETQDVLEDYIRLLRLAMKDKSLKEFGTPSDILQDLLSQGDLRLTKNRRKIYDYWEKVEKKYLPFKTAHINFVNGLEQFSPNIKDLQDKELAKYIKELKEVDVDELQYIFKYPSVKLTTTSGIDKAMTVLDNFLDAVHEQPPERVQTVIGPITQVNVPTGYRTEGEGQVGEVDESETVVEENKVKRLTELWQGNLLEISVDPLYAYAYKQGSAGFKITPTIAGELRKLTNRIKKTAIRLRLERGTLRELDEYIKDIDMKTVIEEGDFYLPYQDEVIEIFDLEEDTKADTEKIRKYLKVVSQFISAGDDYEKPAGMGTSAGKKQHNQKGIPEIIQPKRGTSLPFEGTFRSKLPALSSTDIDIEMPSEGETGTKTVSKNLETLYNELIRAITDYYIDPATSDSKPLARKFSWVETPILSVISKDRMKGNAFITVLGMQMSSTGGILLDETEFGQIIKFLKDLSKPPTKQDVGRFLRKIKGITKTVDRIFEGDDREAVSIEFGRLAYQILKRNSLPTDHIFKYKTIEKPLKELNDEYNPDKIYPFAALYYHATMNQILYSEAGGSYPNIISDLKKLEDKLDIIRKSELETNLLLAHDSIRKMMNKPLYYSISSVDNYEDMQDTLEIMKNKFNTDLTAIEVENIVKDLDSMKNLSLKYGISTEGVYYLKAIHR